MDQEIRRVECHDDGSCPSVPMNYDGGPLGRREQYPDEAGTCRSAVLRARVLAGCGALLQPACRKSMKTHLEQWKTELILAGARFMPDGHA